MLNLFSFMTLALAGRFTTKCEHGADVSRINVYCGRDYQFSVDVTESGWTAVQLDGTKVASGSSLVEYTQWLKDNDMLSLGWEV